MRQFSTALAIMLITIIGMVSYRAHKLEKALQGKDALIVQYRQAIDAQNAAILSAATESQKRLDAYNELLKRPVEIKYMEVKSNDCTDIKNILDDIRSAGF